MSKFTEFELLVLEKESPSCDEVLELMGELHDNELPTSLRGKLHAHLHECEECAALYSEYCQVVAVAKAEHPDFSGNPSDLAEAGFTPHEVKNRLRLRLNQELNISLALHAD